MADSLIPSLSPAAMPGCQMLMVRGHTGTSFNALPDMARIMFSLIYFMITSSTFRLELHTLSETGITLVSLIVLSGGRDSQHVLSSLRTLSALCGRMVQSVYYTPLQGSDSVPRIISCGLASRHISHTDPGFVLPIPSFISDFVPELELVLLPMVPNSPVVSTVTQGAGTVLTQAIPGPLVASIVGAPSMTMVSSTSRVVTSTLGDSSLSVATSHSTTSNLVPITVSEVESLLLTTSPTVSTAVTTSSSAASASIFYPDSDSDSNSSLDLPLSIPFAEVPRRASTPQSLDSTWVYEEGDSIPSTPSPLMSPRTINVLDELVQVLPEPSSNAALLLSEEVRMASPDPILRSVASASPSFEDSASPDDPLIGPRVTGDSPPMDLSFGDFLPLATFDSFSEIWL